MYALAFIIVALWVITPNVALALVTWNRADEDDHLAFAVAAFIPWTLFGLWLQ